MRNIGGDYPGSAVAYHEIAEALIKVTDLIANVQGIVTILGIMLAGAAAYFSRFFSAHLQVGTELKQTIDRKDGAGPAAIVISVKLKNLGRSQVSKAYCDISVSQIEDNQLNLSGMEPVNVPPPEGKEGHCIFESLERLGPGQEVAEDVLFSVNQYATFRATVTFVASTGPLRRRLFSLSAKGRIWTTSVILHAGHAND